MSTISELQLYPGDRYAGFEIVAKLGSGAFARVFAARHPDYRGLVAIKVSRDPITDETTALRALREIRVLEHLRNPHVVHILGHGMGPDERCFMVMELLEGATLAGVHDFDEPMAAARATRLIYEACIGLDEAHRLGIVHRDVKPNNLWVLRSSGRLKVIDFGFARAWDVASTIGEQATVGHMLVGTPHYAQPEQVDSGVLVPASDVYSLGVVLYELLTGHVPLFANEPWSAVVERLRNEPIAWIGAHVKNELVPLTRYVEGLMLPDKLIELVHWMLDKDPSRRPADAGVAARYLAWILHTQFETNVAATLDVDPPGGGSGRRRELLVPGPTTVGSASDCRVVVGDGRQPRIHARIDWLGPPAEAVLSPVAPLGSVGVNGYPLTHPVRLVPGTQIEIAGTRLRLGYPPQATGAQPHRS